MELWISCSCLRTFTFPLCHLLFISINEASGDLFIHEMGLLEFVYLDGIVACLQDSGLVFPAETFAKGGNSLFILKFNLSRLTERKFP